MPARERHSEFVEKLYSALPFLRGALVSRCFTNFIRRDKDLCNTSHPYSLKKTSAVPYADNFF